MEIKITCNEPSGAAFRATVTVPDDATIWEHGVAFVRALRAMEFTDISIEQLFSEGVDAMFDKAYDLDTTIFD